jgi:hypothetical protein
MAFILDDIVSYLNNAGLVTSTYPIFEGYIPDDQDNMMAVFETGGSPPTELGIGNAPRPNQRVTFQFRVRGTRLNYAATRAQWLACFNALQDSVLGNPNVYVYVQTKHDGPICFNDDRGRSNFISNFNVMRTRET